MIRFNCVVFSFVSMERFAATMHICDTEVAAKFAPLLSKVHGARGLDVIETLVDLTISKNQTGPFCRWNGRFYFCDKIFDFVATDEGICYQFNGLRPKDIYRDERFISYVDPDVVDFQNYFDANLTRLNEISGNWSLDTGYVNQGQNSYPQRTVVTSVQKGFFAFLQGMEHNYDYECRSFKQGYKVRRLCTYTKHSTFVMFPTMPRPGVPQLSRECPTHVGKLHTSAPRS